MVAVMIHCGRIRSGGRCGRDYIYRYFGHGHGRRDGWRLRSLLVLL